MNHKSYKMIIIILIVLLLGVVAFLVFDLSKKDRTPGSSAYIDGEASEWDVGIDDDAEIEGRILVPGYSGAKMKTGDTILALKVGNPKENTCYLKATVQLEDGTVLYESGLIEPGMGYDEIELKQTLEPGEYNAYVHYQGYSLAENPEMLNSCDSAFVLKVTE